MVQQFLEQIVQSIPQEHEESMMVDLAMTRTIRTIPIEKQTSTFNLLLR